MRERRFGVYVEQFTGRDEMPGHGVGSGLVQRGQFRADVGGELFSLDGCRDDRSARLLVPLRAGGLLGLCAARTVRAGAPRRAGGGRR